MHDITGSYNQFGVLSLKLNRSPQRPLLESDPTDRPGDHPLETGSTN